MPRRPRIGITMRLELETNRFYLGRDYAEAIEAAGGVPVHIGLIPKAEYIAAVIDDCDGVLLPGSNTDVDPRRYGEDPHPKLGMVIPEKDATDFLVLDEVERRALPLMAICFGMQALNVHRGGSLIQDIGSRVENCIKHEQGPPATRTSHMLRVEPASLIGGLNAVTALLDAIRVNSSHHQALNRVGRYLRPTAWASDGVIESVEDTRTDHFVLATQWHPELTFKDDPLSGELFELFIAECETQMSTQRLAAGN